MRQFSFFLSFLLIFLVAGCTRSGQVSAEDEKLQAFLKAQWEYHMREYPEWATMVGYPGQDDRWTDYSPQAIEGREKQAEAALKELKAIDREGLSAASRLNYDLYVRDLELDIEGHRFPDEWLPISQMGGVQQDVAQTLSSMPAQTQKDFENMLARLRGVPQLVEQTLVLLEEGRKQGITPPRITLRDVPDQIKAQMEADPEKNPLLRPFQEMPAGIPRERAASLRREAAEVLKQQVIPAYRKLHAYFSETYLPATRESVGMSELPEGKAWYAHRAKRYTTTDLSPQQIHDLGKSEVARIRKEMDKVIARSGFKGDFKRFVNHLQSDPRFFYKDEESLLAGYRDISKRVDYELPKLFGTLPRLPYGVMAIPEFMAKSAPTAFYRPGSPEGHRAGTFFANTHDLKSRPKWEMEALTLHEAVPGHHFQIALAQEQKGLPEFRKHGGYTAYVEGWGLYAESLGEELGFYRDPYAKFGQLTYEIWRAIRLVVDTGMHELGWTREQAIGYFLENSGKARHDVVVEVDRYIVWPGQALAYKIGELKFKELRAYAQSRLKDRFDIRAFHDQVLSEGALPLDVLDRRLRAWVDGQTPDASGAAE